MTRLFFSTSWIPYFARPIKHEHEHKHKHRSKSKSKNKSESKGSKEPSQARSETRVQGRVERTVPGPPSPRLPSPRLPPVELPPPGPSSNKPPSPGFPPSGASALGPPSLSPPGQATPASKPPSQDPSLESKPLGPPAQILAAEVQQESKAVSAASNDGRNTVRGPPPSENTTTSRESQPRNDPGPGTLTSRSTSRRGTNDNSSQRRRTEGAQTRKQNHEFAVEADRKIPEQEKRGRSMDDAPAKERTRRQSRRVSKSTEDCMAPQRRMTHRGSTAERNRQEGTAYHQTTEDWVTNENGHGSTGTQSVREAPTGEKHEDERRSRRQQASRSVQRHSSAQPHGRTQHHGSAQHDSARHGSARRSSARHGSVVPNGSYDPPVYGPRIPSPPESEEPPTFASYS